MRIKFIKTMHSEIPEGTVFIGDESMKYPFRRITDIYEYNGILQTKSIKHQYMPEYNIQYALDKGFAVVDEEKDKTK